MPHPPRYDKPGRWFHVMNRGMSRRTVFETRRDIRYFLSRVAYAVRRGEIEVHSFCIMTTHFHLLVRSPVGKLADAMRRIQGEYVCWFNRPRVRDGSLCRGRYLSKLVMSLMYRSICVRYIDYNPVKAGLAKKPSDYPHGSAARFARKKPPPWLCGDWVLRSKGSEDASSEKEPTEAELEFMRQRIAARPREDDPLDDLVRAAPSFVRRWMVRQAQLADGTRPGLPCVPASTVMSVARRLQDRGRIWWYRTPSGRRRDAWRVATAGLLRHLAAQTHHAITERMGTSMSITARSLAKHAELCETPDYATRLGRVGMLCMRTAFPDAK